jgi:hypothetical protein
MRWPTPSEVLQGAVRGMPLPGPAVSGPYSLEEAADQAGLSIEDEIRRGDADLRKWMAIRIVWTFIGGNIVTLIALGALVWLDQTNLDHGLIKPGDRIITYRVIMTLLAATTVQVGTIAAIIARYLFPGRSRDDQHG